MTYHFIQSETEFHRFHDTEDGSNSVPKEGRYHQINGYYRSVGKYLRAQRGVKYNTETGQYSYGNYLYVGVPSWNPDLGSYNFHLAKCIEKMHNAFDSVQLAKDLAEAATASARFFKSVPQSIRYLRKGNFAKAYTSLAGSSTVRQSIPATYLQYQWAVRPLISELEELWEKLSPKKAPLFRISEASGKSESRETAVYYTMYNQTITSCLKQSVNYSVKAVRYFRHDVLDSQGFHFNPLGAIWDGIPWSFLVDWFIPVSDVLKGMSYSIPGCVAGFDNTRYESRTEVTGVYPYEVHSASGRWHFRLEWPDSNFRQFTFRRIPNTSTSLNAAQINELLWSSPAGLTLKRTLNLFNVAWVFASRK
jgi:hypothetical protein